MVMCGEAGSSSSRISSPVAKPDESAQRNSTSRIHAAINTRFFMFGFEFLQFNIAAIYACVQNLRIRIVGYRDFKGGLPNLTRHHVSNLQRRRFHL